MAAERINGKAIADEIKKEAAAEAAGVPFIFAAYGFGNVEGFPSVDRPAGLLELLDL